MDWPGSIQLIDAVVGLGTFTFSAYVGLATWRRHRSAKQVAAGVPPLENFSKSFLDHQERISANPWVISINLLDRQVSAVPEIKSYFGSLKMKPSGIREVSFEGIRDVAEDMERFLHELRKIRQEMDIEVATEVHLFIAGPLAAAVYVGAALDNWKLVKVYQWHPQSGYQYWGVLQK